MNTVLLDDLIVEIRNGVDKEQHNIPIGTDVLPISRIETIADGTINFSRVKYARFTEAEIEKYQLREGDILFSHINSPTHIGKTAIYNSSNPLIHGINLLLLRLDKKRCAPSYLNYYLKSKPVRTLFSTRCKKAVNQASLNQGDITSIDVPLPPLEEQKRIAGILENADKLRRQRRYSQELSNNFLQSVFLRLFGDLLKEERWKFDKLSSIAEVVSGVAKGQKYDGKETIMVPYLRVANVQDGYLDLSEIKHIQALPSDVEFLKLQEGDVLMTEGGDFDKLGRGAIWRNQIEICIHQNHIFRVRLNNKFTLPSFFSAYLLTPLVKAYFLKCAKQTTNLASINMTQLKALPAPLVPIELQKNFIQIVEKFEWLQAQQQEASRQAEHLFETLLHRAFRGEL